MSHLSTIIDRVKRKRQVYNGDMETGVQDGIFEQAVINLLEYQDAWTDATPEEKTEANKLYAELRPQFSGQGMPSHKARLKEADAIYDRLTAEHWIQYPMPDGPLDGDQCPRCYSHNATMTDTQPKILRCSSCKLEVMMGPVITFESDDPEKLKDAVKEMLGMDEDEKEGEQ